MKKFIETNLVLVWVIASILFALIIQIAFSLNAPCNLLDAKWEAGDLLTYVSTVALGLLAVWQNRKFKEESDASQARLESLSRQANEYSVISKIIEIEAGNLLRLRQAIDEFSSACDPQELTKIYSDADGSSNQMVLVLAGVAAAEKRIDDSFFALSRELRAYPKPNQDLILDSAGSYYYAAKKFIEEVRNAPTKEATTEVQILSGIKIAFIEKREKLLIFKEQQLHEVVYGNLTLDEIKKIYLEGNLLEKGIATRVTN